MGIRYTIVFDRTWRVGSGEAAGRYLDRLVRLDGAGLPFVPGTTIRGVVGDAVRDLMDALEVAHCDGTLQKQDGRHPTKGMCGVNLPGICPLCRVKGSPAVEPAVDWGPARLVLEGPKGPIWDTRQREAVARQMEAVPGFLTQPHPRTAIDAVSGRADDEHLFALEEVRAGVSLQGEIEVREDLAPLELALLVGALRWVRELGGGRRRGQGGCRIRIDAADLAPAFRSWEEAVERLPELAADRGQEENEGVAAGGGIAERPGDTGQTGEGAARAFTETVLGVEAVVVGEVVVGGRPDSGNVVAGLPYVPGSVLRGALAARWQGDVGGPEFTRAFLEGGVRFGFLYPRSGGAAAQPVSRAIHTCKERPGRRPAGHGLVDVLEADAGDGERCRECKGRLEPLAPAFKGVADDEARLLLSPHNRIDPESQTVREGSLFAYEAMPEGRSLKGFLRAETPAALANLLDGLGLSLNQPFRLRVGRRKGALGYLEVRLTRYRGKDAGVSVFPDAASVPATWPAGSALRVELLTPAVLLDRHLRHKTRVEPEDLGLDRDGFDHWIAATEVISGWNAAHRLPKPDDVAVAAGSTFILERPPTDDGADRELAVVREIAREGIGLRRIEGFGAIRVRTMNWGAQP